MNYWKLLEVYIGRKIRDDEVVLQDDGNGVYIREWNIADLPEPNLQELQTAFADKYNKQLQIEEYKAKIKKARELILRAQTYVMDDVKIQDYITKYKNAIVFYKFKIKELKE